MRDDKRGGCRGSVHSSWLMAFTGRQTMTRLIIVVLFVFAVPAVWGREYHVAISGDDANDGTAAKPLKTISAAARLAGPGDVITVHDGVYRERISPPRGGDSDQRRITYQAAPGEKV